MEYISLTNLSRKVSLKYGVNLKSSHTDLLKGSNPEFQNSPSNEGNKRSFQDQSQITEKIGLVEKAQNTSLISLKDQSQSPIKFSNNEKIDENFIMLLHHEIVILKNQIGAQNSQIESLKDKLVEKDEEIERLLKIADSVQNH